MKGRTADTPVQTDTEKVAYVRLAQKRLNYAGLWIVMNPRDLSKSHS
jgi:hypothetical protein